MRLSATLPALVLTTAALLAPTVVTVPAAAQAENDLELQQLPTVVAFDDGLDFPQLNIVSIGDHVVFAAFRADTGTEVWSSDGETTELIADIRPGTETSLPLAFERVGDRALFSADDGTHGRELWTSDGTASGTAMLRDFNQGATDSNFRMIGEIPAGYAFVANTQLWITDGTSAGTTMVTNGPVTGRPVIVNDEIWNVSVADDVLSILISDGTGGGTTQLVGPAPATDMNFLGSVTPFGNGVIFSAFDFNAGSEPWISDGTIAGTQRLADINTSPRLGPGGPVADPDQNGSSGPNNFVAVGDVVYFEAAGEGLTRSTFRTDGTEAGTVPVTEPSSISFAPRRPTMLGNRLVLAAQLDDGLEPWITSIDGTAVAQIADIAPGAESSLTVDQPLGLEHVGLSFIPFVDQVLFAADDGTNGNQVWATDGTANGTFRVSDLNKPGGLGTSVPGNATITGPNGPIAFFAADDGSGAFRMWTVQARGEELEVSVLGARYADDQVLRLYQAALGREPDEAGLAFWVERYQTGERLDSLAANFAGSAEFIDRFGENTTDEELVALLYRNVLGRNGEPAGVDFWLGQLANGVSRASVITSFAESEENIQRTGTSTPITSAESKILRLYRAAFGRIPDEAGFAFWVTTFQLDRSLTEIAGQFRRSPEFADLYGEDVSDEVFVDLLYRNVLGRSGDEGGVDFWLGQLAGGVSRDAVLVSFSESPENLERTNTIP